LIPDSPNAAPDDPPPIAAFTDVAKSYRLGEVEVPALKGINLTIERGRFSVIIGPSGSGKTTLLNLLGCIDAPTSGTVALLGRRTSDLADDQMADLRRRHIGFIFQNFSLVPVLTAYENVEYPLIMAKTPAKARRQAVEAMLAAVGLADRRDHYPNQLSGGQRQRVAIARALVKRPSLVIADEPTANLDSRTGREIIEMMRRIQDECETTFVFSTHDPDILDYAAKVYTMHDGRLH
jgi:putative ABC transport system ATP-binding protein